MDKKKIDSDIKNYKIREGWLYKRSKFLKDWRKRWVVLTTNFIYTFTDNKYDQVTDAIDLKEIHNYKSYLRKDEEMIPAGFKIRSNEDMYYFSAKDTNEKWSWLVTLERLMDYKVVGSSFYNNYDWIKTKGFDSQVDYQNGGQINPVIPTIQGKSQEQIKKELQAQTDKLMKELQEQRKELSKKEQQLIRRETEIQRKNADKKVEQAPPPPPAVQKSEPEPKKPVQKPIQDKKVEESKKEPIQSPASIESQVSTSKVSELRKMYEGK